MTNLPDEFKERAEKWRNLKRERPAHVEVAGPGQESVWDYPRPPRVEPADQHIRVEFGGVVVAFLPRAITPVSRTMLWYQRVVHFGDALLSQDWEATYRSYHPGVTAM